MSIPNYFITFDPTVALYISGYYDPAQEDPGSQKERAQEKKLRSQPILSHMSSLLICVQNVFWPYFAKVH